MPKCRSQDTFYEFVKIKALNTKDLPEASLEIFIITWLSGISAIVGCRKHPGP